MDQRKVVPIAEALGMRKKASRPGKSRPAGWEEYEADISRPRGTAAPEVMQIGVRVRGALRSAFEDYLKRHDVVDAPKCVRWLIAYAVAHDLEPPAQIRSRK